MQNQNTMDDLLGLNLTLNVSPIITFDLGAGSAALPGEGGRFQLTADAALQYASLSQILNDYLSGKRFNLSDGLFAKHVIVKNVVVGANQSGAIVVKVAFGGSFNGSIVFTGTPVYNEETKTIVLLNFWHDVQTNSLLLKAAKMLFASRIEKELKKSTRFSIEKLLAQIQKAIYENLNKEWTKGLTGSGEVEDLRLLSLQVLPEHLLMRTTCGGTLQINVSGLRLDFKR